MKRFALAVLLLLLFCELKAENQTNYFWNTNSFHYQLKNDLILNISEKTHFIFNEAEINFYYFDFTVLKPLNRSLSIGLGIRRLMSKASTSWSVENRIMAYLNYKKKGKNIDFHFNNRISYQQYPLRKYNLRYYHKLTFYLNIPVVRDWLHPFFTEEVFVKMNKENFHMGRAYAGFRFLQSKPISIDLFYAENFQKNSAKAWNRNGIIGANFSIQLN